MKRIFIAVRVEPEEALLKMISFFKQALKNDSIRWKDPSNIHITLVFLGDTEEKRVGEIDILLKELCKGFGSFDLLLSGAGVFRNTDNPRVIWTGIGYSEKILMLNELITEKLLETGTKLEEKPYSPHLTLGRVKKINCPVKLKEMIDGFNGKEIQRVNVKEIILYESILRPEGPVYKLAGRYSLD